MGFSYSVGFPNWVHSFGHRMESTIRLLYSWRQNRFDTFADRFSLTKYLSPDYDFSSCGEIDYPPHNQGKYNYWIRSSKIPNICDDYYKSFPYKQNIEEFEKKDFNCGIWNCTDIGYYEWWFSHIPNFNGTNPFTPSFYSKEDYNDWWIYFLNPNEAIKARYLN